MGYATCNNYNCRAIRRERLVVAPSSDQKNEIKKIVKKREREGEK